jgi:hypothetical protein
MAAENVLFYSMNDNYSRQVYGLVNSYNIQNQFIVVNIDNPQYKLPGFVDRVPMIFIKAKNQLVVDEHIPQYIETLRPKPQHVPQQQQQQQPELLSMSDMGRGISDSFSFIDGSGSGGTPGNFVFLENQNQSNHNPNPNPQSQQLPSLDVTKQARFDSSEFERYAALRDADMASFKQQRR